MEWLQNIDWWLMNAIQALRCDFLDFLMPIITFLCDGGWIWIVTGVVLLFFQQSRRYGIILLLGLLLGSILGNDLIKPLVERPRPFMLHDIGELLITKPSSFSFPSGHTVSSFVAMTVLWRFDRRLGIPAAVVGSLIAFSRMYLYVHFPTDILAGAVLGVAVALLMQWLVVKIIRALPLHIMLRYF